MKLDEIIRKQRLIDVNLFSNQKVSYTGVCVKANKNIWILVNYDYKKKLFNGFTIFKNSIVETFSLWKKKYVNIEKNNLKEFTDLMSFSNVKTIYSSIKWANYFGLIAVFTETNTRSYFVGKVVYLNNKNVILRLITKEGKWTRRKTISLKKIDFISFHTDYEISLLEKSCHWSSVSK